MVLFLSILAAAATASAKPKPAARDEPKLSDAEKAAHKTMAAELRRGRGLANKGQHAEAIAAYDKALASVPDEPHVLLELGVELRATGDLARAEDVCRKLASPGGDPSLRAPALFNLGRVLEDKKDTGGAVTAYRESLKLRENRFVRERLFALDPTAQSDVTRPAPLDGPVASLAAWCAAHKDTPCHLDDPAVGGKLDAPAAPWLEARVFTIEDEGEIDCALGVRTQKGWYVAKLEYCADHEFRHDVQVELEASDGIASGTGAELVVTFHGTDSMKDFDPQMGHSVCCIDQELVLVSVCGVGPSGAPACTPQLQLTQVLVGRKTSEVHLEARFTDGELDLVRADGKAIDDAKARLDPDLRGLAGRHRILFP